MPKKRVDSVPALGVPLRLAENVQWLRTKLNWSTRALAQHSKISLSTLYLVEHPKDGTTRLSTVEKLARGFGVHPSTLLGSDKQVRTEASRIPAIKLVGANLRKLRQARSMSQDVLATESLVARHLIAKIETNAHSNPTLELLGRLCLVLGVAIDELFADDTSMDGTES